MLALQALTPQQLCDVLPEVDLPEARRVVAATHRDEPVTQRLGLRRTARLAVAEKTHVPTLSIAESRASSLDPFQKFVVATHDGHLVETVRIPLEKAGRYSVCVSSQVGCAMACAFCATGRLGLTRNLATWEIVEQVRVVRRSLAGIAGARIHGIVFQGMGEPLANVDNVLRTIAVLSDPCAQAIDARCMTVCTSGHPAGILRLAREAPRVRLGLSLGSARPDVRRTLMPLDAVHPLATVLDAAATHVALTGLAPMWAVTLLAGVNDSDADAHALGELAAGFHARTGKWPMVSVIPYNRISDDAGDPFRRTADDAETRFRDILASHSVFARKRYSGGHDVDAACGQLAARSATTPAGRALLAARA